MIISLEQECEFEKAVVVSSLLCNGKKEFIACTKTPLNIEHPKAIRTCPLQYFFYVSLNGDSYPLCARKCLANSR